MTLLLRYAARSDRGLVRGNNEDSVYAGARLLALADGMGGHAAGEVASSMAARAVRETLAEEQDLLLSYEQGNETSRQGILELMEKASQRACSSLAPFSDST